MKTIRVIANDLSSWITSVNEKCSNEEIAKYYIGNQFNISTPRDEEVGKEHLVMAIKIEFLDNNNSVVSSIGDAI